MIATGQARRSHRQERIATWLLRSASAFVIIVMAFLLIYLTFEGTKTFTVDGVSPLEFLFSPNYQPDTKHPGALVFIVGSLSITLFAIVVGGPFGIAVGVFLSELAPKQMSGILKPAIEVMVGVPSVVYGWIGLTLLVPLMRQITGGVGFGLASSGIVLAIMILPTVISLSEDAFKSLPGSLKEASMAVGATRWQTIVQVLLPAASSGLTVAVILGIARAVGETLAVQLVIGNATILPAGLFAPTAALTTEIITDMPGAAPNSPLEHALFSMALLLLLIAMGLIVLVRFALRKRN